MKSAGYIEITLLASPETRGEGKPESRLAERGP
jgi:hypothetical protein